MGARLAPCGISMDGRYPGDAPSPRSERWYVVHTQPHAERRAAQHLEQQAYTVFCPLLRRPIRHARQTIVKAVPLFPRYLFVRFGVAERQWRSVNGTLGVVRLIMQGDKPQAVPEGVVEHLQHRMIEAGGSVCEPALHVGEPVRIESGPFAGLMATLERLDERGRVCVLLELLGRSVAVTLDGDVVSSAA